EDLVAIARYGLQGLSYYSQPNKTTVDPVPGVSPDIFVRRSVALKLVAVNERLLRDDKIARLLGGRVELNIREGFRSTELIAYLHGIAIPNLLRKLFPEWSEEEITARRDKTISAPEWSPTSLPPHLTGGAVDVSLQYAGTDEQVF